MFLFRKKDNTTEDEKKQNVQVNNPFQNIQKDAQDVKSERNLQNDEKNMNSSDKNDEEKEEEEKKKKKKNSIEEKESTINKFQEENQNGLKEQDTSAQDSDNLNNQVKEDQTKYTHENLTSAGDNNIRKEMYRFIPSEIKKKKINLYSSSSSASSSEEENIFTHKNKRKMKDLDLDVEEYEHVRKRERTEEIQQSSNITSRTRETNTINMNRKIFANISSSNEKLVFLTKKVREEIKRKSDKKENVSFISMGEENRYKKDSRKKEIDNRRGKRDIDNKTYYNDDRYRTRKKIESNEEIRKRESEINERRRKVSSNEESNDEQNCKHENGEEEEEENYKDRYGKVESSLAELNMLHISNIERESQKEKELEIIKQQYLGLNKKKKKMQKPSEKFRNIFNFEWDQSEDTSRNDSNPLYQNRLEPQLLFGRGYIAGIDVREQRKKNNFYDNLVQNRINFSMRKGTGSSNSQKKDSLDKSDADVDNIMNGIANHTTSISSLSNTSNPMEHFTNLNNNSLSRSKTGELIYEPKINNIIQDVHNKHWSEKKREEMTDRDWRIFREDNEIYIKGGVVPPPIRRWEESNLSSDLLKAIKKAKYENPTPIQMQAIPIALEMRDLIGIAETGSGKTAAFVLPMLSYVKQLPPLTYETSQDGPYALVIAPSRELAIQIFDETNKFASYCSCRTVAVVGGRNAEAQAFELRRGVEIVIGTPGRIQDCLEKAYTVLNQCNYVILDEADRMMDMGFEDSVHFILDRIPTSNLKSEDDALALQEEMMAKAGHRLYRLTQMFSATMPPAVERLSRKYLRAPAYISIGDPGAGKRSIEQKLEFITEGKKKQKLQEILENYEPPIIVFVNQKKVADIIAKSISKMKFRAVSLHGGKAQEIREQTLNSFKNADYDILVATDVAGRGIDVHGVKLVINFDMPKDIESYTHRIGRTGRAGMKGLAISFVTEQDTHLFYDLKQFLISSNNIVPMELANNPASKVKPGTVIQNVKKSQVLFKS
ncbi:ATP-dependent RNA helicase DDX23 [Plasmodium gonderi]|uniref:RNA helicase n=1 Tax=Plasmodium gonderi TaxID=77519 RepID=A0A1Y1JKQ2_PLAGO|nr:ATP-dependent RNA helicase DDX23 [Plasmodium gonderi]GAW81372.1 ATP-dependent RNA helicase DDX23 [Plasmodium gonderi]